MSDRGPDEPPQPDFGQLPPEQPPFDAPGQEGTPPAQGPPFQGPAHDAPAPFDQPDQQQPRQQQPYQQPYQQPGAGAWEHTSTTPPPINPEWQQAPQSPGWNTTFPAQWPESSNAGTALAMSIVGLALNVLCGCFAGPLALPFSVIGLVMANTESTAIAAGRRDPAGDGNARAAYVIGIIGLVIGALVLMLWIFVFGVGIWGALGSSTNS